MTSILIDVDETIIYNIPGRKIFTYGENLFALRASIDSITLSTKLFNQARADFYRSLGVKDAV